MDLLSTTLTLNPLDIRLQRCIPFEYQLLIFNKITLPWIFSTVGVKFFSGKIHLTFIAYLEYIKSLRNLCPFYRRDFKKC